MSRKNTYDSNQPKFFNDSTSNRMTPNWFVDLNRFKASQYIREQSLLGRGNFCIRPGSDGNYALTHVSKGKDSHYVIKILPDGEYYFDVEKEPPPPKMSCLYDIVKYFLENKSDSKELKRYLSSKPSDNTVDSKGFKLNEKTSNGKEPLFNYDIIEDYLTPKSSPNRSISAIESPNKTSGIANKANNGRLKVSASFGDRSCSKNISNYVNVPTIETDGYANIEKSTKAEQTYYPGEYLPMGGKKI